MTLPRIEQSSNGTFTIGQVAIRLGVHPNTIRNWEAQGIISSDRSPTGLKLFDKAEVERMRAEMFATYAPATEMSAVAKRPKGRVVTGDEL